MGAYVLAGGGLFALSPFAWVDLFGLIHPLNLVCFLLLPKQLFINLQAKDISKQCRLLDALRPAPARPCMQSNVHKTYLVNPSLQHRIIHKLQSILCFKDELVVELRERNARIAIEFRRVGRKASRGADAVVRAR